MVSDMNRLNELLGLMTSNGESRQIKAMFYSPFGAGKTTLALQVLDKVVPQDKAILMVDTSFNKDVVAQAGITHKVVPLPFTTIEDLRLITEAITQGVAPWDMIGGILFDEASSMAEEDIDRVYETRKTLIANGKMATPREGVPLTPDWADYRPALQRFRSMLSDLYDIPNMHVIMCAHENVKMNGANIVSIAPNFSPKTLESMGKPLHLIARLTAQAQPDANGNAVYTREVQIHPTGKITAKSRLGTATVKFGAEYLPGLIKNWLDAGANEAPEQAPAEQLAGDAGSESDDDNPFDN